MIASCVLFCGKPAVLKAMGSSEDEAGRQHISPSAQKKEQVIFQRNRAHQLGGSVIPQISSAGQADATEFEHNLDFKGSN